jgi:hypothetical protein
MTERPLLRPLAATRRPGIRRLTYDEMAAGEPCPACGRPLLDNEGGFTSRGTMHFTPDERDRYETEEATWRASHGRDKCHGGPWRMSGSVTTHSTFRPLATAASRNRGARAVTVPAGDVRDDDVWS